MSDGDSIADKIQQGIEKVTGEDANTEQEIQQQAGDESGPSPRETRRRCPIPRTRPAAARPPADAHAP